PRLTECLEMEQYRRLLPGRIRHFVEKASLMLDLEIGGDLDGYFGLRPNSGAPELLAELLEELPEESRERLTVHRPDAESEAIFVHPGGRLFEALRACVNARFADDALRGAVFVDPAANRPYLYHLALLAIERQADPALRDLARAEVLEYRLIGLRQEEDGAI